jgi:iron complex transport system permease protein
VGRRRHKATIRESGDLPRTRADRYLFAKKRRLPIQHAGSRGARSAARTASLVGLAAALAAAACVALAFGSVRLDPGALAFVLFHPSTSGFAHEVLWQLRMPRACIAACVGAGLGVAGAMLQAVFRNPLVDPYVSGVSAGSALAATLGIAAGASFAAIPAIAFGGGLGCAALVAALGAGSGSSANLRLVLAGVALSALCSAGVALVLLRQGPSSELSVISWLAGDISGRGWLDLAWAGAYLAVGLVGAAASVHPLNVLRLGPSAAAGLGLRVDAARWRTIGLAALITAACVSVSGVIGFVGLMVPHGARRLVGGDAAWVLPASALLGGVVMVVADTLARTLAPPTEIPLSVLLALVGVPFFLFIARRPVDV